MMIYHSPVTSALSDSTLTETPDSTESQGSAGKLARTRINGNGRSKPLATATPSAIRAHSETHSLDTTTPEDY
jgi:hypothetical protein